MSTTAYRNLDRLTPEMRERVEKFLQEAQKENFDILITETWRSRERQEYLYSLGRTRPGRVVTWTLQSKHLEGIAVDIAFKQGTGITYQGDWEGIGHIGERVGLTWGGRWPTPDRPHFQFNPSWQGEHWAVDVERRLINTGVITQKKDLNTPPSRGELYTILTRLHNL